MPTDSSVLNTIRDLVGEEHTLRAAQADPAQGQQAAPRLQELEAELDQCWDLLRQRRALRVTGADPQAANVRPVSRVTSYLQ